MQYTIVEEFRKATFESEVAYLLKQGWTLQGGVSIALNPQTNNTYYAQALIKAGE